LNKVRGSQTYILIPTHNRSDILCSTLAQIRAQLTEERTRVVVVDAGSTDGTRAKVLAKYPSVDLVDGHADMWWTATVNYGLKYIMKEACSGDHVLLMNDDIDLSHDTLIRLLEASIAEPKAIIGAVNLIQRSGELPKMYFCGGQYDLIFARHKANIPAGKPWVFPVSRFMETDYLFGRLLNIPVDAFELGCSFDDETFPQYCADEDFTYGAKLRGVKTLVDTKSVLYVNETTTAHFSLSFFKSGVRGVYNALTAFNSYYNWRQSWAFACRYARWPLIFFLCRYAIQFINDNVRRR